MQTCLRLCARQVTTNLARQWTLQSSSSCVMAPKKTPTVDTKQRGIASFFGAASGGARPGAKSAGKASATQAATEPAADEAAEKHPNKRIRKSAEPAAVADVSMPADLMDVEEPASRESGTAEPDVAAAAARASPINGHLSPGPQSPAKQRSGTGQSASPASGSQREVRPSQGNAPSQPDSGPHVALSVLVDAFDRITGTTKRLVKEAELKACLRAIMDVNGADLLPTVYLITNRIAPAHEAAELGIGEAQVVKALAKCLGQGEKQIRDKAKELGDLGEVAVKSHKTQSKLNFASKKVQPSLTIQEVYQKFWEIKRAEGKNSAERKQAIIQGLIGSCKSGTNEAGLIGKTRIGLGEQTVLVSLAQACLAQRAGTKDVPQAALEEGVSVIKQAYSQCPSYDLLVPACLEVAAGKISIQDILNSVKFGPGMPVKAMLAKATHGISEVLDKYQDQPFTVEYKYDGERAQASDLEVLQIHYDEAGKVHVFSRNSENMQGKYPDIIAMVPRHLAEGVKSLVIDCEAVAWDKQAQKVLPFQLISTRKRKDVKLEDIKVPAHLFAFDCLYLNGRSLLSEPLTERRKQLQSAIVPSADELSFAQFKTSTDVEELGVFLNEAVAAGTEGLIVKSLDSTYEPSKRSVNWLKLKKDYLEGVGDTFDLVPIGAWLGRGKRTGVYGAFLLAIYDDDNEVFQTISKIGTGFSEELLKTLYDEMHELAIERPPKYYSYSITPKDMPNVWFEAKAVWEVKAADLSISPVHKAAQGLVDAAKGISIRFPRLVRVRDDKQPEQATTPEQVADMYRKQACQPKKAAAEDDDD